MKKANAKIIPPELEPINLEESKRLISLEAEISFNIDSFVEVAKHLLEIRDSKLYRSEYHSFEDYCKGKWNISKSTAYELISTSEVNENVRNSGQEPVNQSVAIELSKLPPEQQAPALQEATQEAQSEGNGKPTAKQVKKVVKKRTAASNDNYEPAMKFIARVCGPELEGRIRAGKSLSVAEVITFYGLDEDECVRLKPYLEAGWKLKAALGYKSTQLTPAHTIRQLCDRAIEFGKLTLDLEDWTITVTKKEKAPEDNLPTELTGK